jgi:hypothetical protein
MTPAMSFDVELAHLPFRARHPLAAAADHLADLIATVFANAATA